jgi:hypothetical protein
LKYLNHHTSYLTARDSTKNSFYLKDLEGLSFNALSLLSPKRFRLLSSRGVNGRLVCKVRIELGWVGTGFLFDDESFSFSFVSLMICDGVVTPLGGI